MRRSQPTSKTRLDGMLRTLCCRTNCAASANSARTAFGSPVNAVHPEQHLLETPTLPPPGLPVHGSSLGLVPSPLKLM